MSLTLLGRGSTNVQGERPRLHNSTQAVKSSALPERHCKYLGAYNTYIHFRYSTRMLVLGLP